MSILVWAASAMVAASIPVAWWALAGERPSKLRASRQLVGANPTMRQAVLERSAVERMLLPVARQIGTRIVGITPLGWVERRSLALTRAGLSGRVTAEQLLGAKLGIPVFVAGLVGVQAMAGAPWHLVLLLLAFAVIGFFLPDLLVRAMADRRADTIVRALPDLLDQMTVSVEAGLGFESALARATTRPHHPLDRELLRMLQEIRFGSTRADALTALAHRVQVDDLNTVILALRQADTLGVPLGDTLRIVASDMREKRRFRAEERAQRLPTIMIFPLGLCFMPALFIVVLGPAMIQGTGLD